VKKMKLEAAQRLHQVLSQEKAVDLQYLTDVMTEQGISTVVPDDTNNSVIADIGFKEAITAFALRRWTPIEQRDSGGGLYCNSTSVIMEREGQKFKLTHTAHHRIVLWVSDMI